MQSVKKNVVCAVFMVYAVPWSVTHTRVVYLQCQSIYSFSAASAICHAKWTHVCWCRMAATHRGYECLPQMVCRTTAKWTEHRRRRVVGTDAATNGCIVGATCNAVVGASTTHKRPYAIHHPLVHKCPASSLLGAAAQTTHCTRELYLSYVYVVALQRVWMRVFYVSVCMYNAWLLYIVLSIPNVLLWFLESR